MWYLRSAFSLTHHRFQGANASYENPQRENRRFSPWTLFPWDTYGIFADVGLDGTGFLIADSAAKLIFRAALLMHLFPADRL